MEFSEIQKLVYEEYKKNGYLEMWTKVPLDKNDFPRWHTDNQEIADIAEVGLINTEVSEALDAIREYGYPLLRDKLGEELADVIIRALNFASRKGIDLEPYILSKHEVNLERGDRHGKNI